MSTSYKWEEIATHNNEKSCWVVLYGKVLDVTDWLNLHPGGLDPINDMAGQDITKMYETIGHTKDALQISEKYVIGIVDKGSRPPVIEAKSDTAYARGGTEKALDKTKFVVKEDPTLQMIKMGLVAFVMLLVAMYVFS